MDKTFERSLLNALIILDKEGCKLARTGICGNVFHMLTTDAKHPLEQTMIYSKILDNVNKIVQDWPHFSGDCHWPIEGSSLQFHRHVNKWSGAYGNLRKDLLKHLIKTLEKELEN